MSATRSATSTTRPRKSPSFMRPSSSNSFQALATDDWFVQQGMRILLPKPRASFHDATSAYSAFAAVYNHGQLAEGWPMLAQLHWGLLAVQQSQDWQLRDHIDPTLLTAVVDLQRRTLDAFAQLDAPPK